jgi:hypothetical protein
MKLQRRYGVAHHAPGGPEIKSSIAILFLDHISNVARKISFHIIFWNCSCCEAGVCRDIGNLDFVQDHRGRARHSAIGVEGMAPIAIIAATASNALPAMRAASARLFSD